MIAIRIIGRATMLLAAAAICSGDDNAPAVDRDLVASLLKSALAPQAAMASWRQEALEERHREEFIGIVTYWWSRVAGDAKFRDPANTLEVTVPKMIRGKDRSIISLVAKAPLDGNVSGEVLTDSKAKLVGISTAFHCVLNIPADVAVSQEMKDGKAHYKIRIEQWAPAFHEVKFDHDLVDKLRGPLGNLANNKLRPKADELKETINKALKDAYETGRLTLP